MSPLFEVPQTFEQNLESRLNFFTYSLKEPARLAEAIRNLSNLFIKGNVTENYWKDANHRASYLSYFSVLNFVRDSAVFREAARLGFLSEAKKIADWGCGAGAATWAGLTELNESFSGEICGIDKSAEALEEYSHWLTLFRVKPSAKKLELKQLTNHGADTLILSYVLNEVDSWPEIPLGVQRLVIMEPSTNQAGRRLLEWRQKFLNEGWFAWAPCTHQYGCPLILNSSKDWCHHRVHWIKPQWFLELEKFLPMKNDTLTVSYLLISRQPPPSNLNGLARVVGDEQEEKGKTRQMICRGPQREFLSWLHRTQISLKMKRGDLLQIGKVDQRSNELRVNDASEIQKIEN